jgi:hypothetical protein
MTAAACYETIGRILRTKPNEVEALIETIVDPKAATDVRCAALDRYVEVRKARSFELLTDIVEDFDQPEELRAHCQHWLLDPRTKQGMVATRGAVIYHGVVTKGGAVQTSGAVDARGRVTRTKAKKRGAEPSDRLRWLKSL